MNTSLRFHWSLSQAGNKFRRTKRLKDLSGVIDRKPQLELCRKAEENGIDSVLMAIGFTRPDPGLQTVVLAQETSKINFMIAVRTGLISPSFFVQQINTIAALTNGRLHINIVGGYSPKELAYYGDHLPHDERYDRSAEFLEICNKFWNGEQGFDYSGKYYQVEKAKIATPFRSPTHDRPEIFIGGNSVQAANLAAKHADCLWRFPDKIEELKSKIKPVIDAGKEAGLLVSLIARPSQEEAFRDAYNMIQEINPSAKEAHIEFKRDSDSIGFRKVLGMAEGNQSHWVDDCLWTGAVPYLGAPSIALLGSYETIAKKLMEYKAIGISQFLFMGWPDIEEVEHFGKGVLPLVREMEALESQQLQKSKL